MWLCGVFCLGWVVQDVRFPTIERHGRVVTSPYSTAAQTNICDMSESISTI